MTSTPNLLLVDDDRVDTLAVRRSLRGLDISCPVVSAQDRIEALERLRGEDGHARIELPLVLLDLNMPRMGGLDFLKELRRDPVLRPTEVSVMTTSSAPEDRTRGVRQ